MPLPPVSLRQLRAFVTIARLGSLRRAAVDLHISQPSLSQGMKQLEEALACKLMVRDARGSTLTEAGQQLLSTCESVFASLEFTFDSLQKQSGRHGQPLRIAALPSLARQIVLPAYRALSEEEGKPQLFIRDAIGEEVVRMVRSREVDFSLSAPPSDNTGLVVQPLLHSPLRAVMAVGHPLACGASWQDLARERFIFVARHSFTYELVTGGFHEARCFPKNYVETHTAETAARMAAEGMGVTVLHAGNIDEIEHLGFAHAPLVEPEVSLPVVLIRLASRPLPPSPGMFWDRLVAAAEHVVPAWAS